MSRITDTERGARLAYEIAQVELQNLFPELPREFWERIADEASVTIAECSFLRHAQADRRCHCCGESFDRCRDAYRGCA